MIILIASAATVALYLLRLFALKGTKHKHLTISFHEALFALSVWCGYQAWEGNADFGHIAGLTGAILWLYESWPTWGLRRPPQHTESASMPFDELEHRG